MLSMLARALGTVSSIKIRTEYGPIPAQEFSNMDAGCLGRDIVPLSPSQFLQHDSGAKAATFMPLKSQVGVDFVGVRSS